MPGAISVIRIRNELLGFSQRVNVSAAIRSLTLFGPAVSGDLRELQRGHEEHGRDNSQHGASAQRMRLESNRKGGWHTS